jgi:hypothetical protein
VPERKRPLERPRRVCEDTIKLGLQKIGLEDTDWIYLAQDRTLVHEVIKPSGSIK